MRRPVVAAAALSVLALVAVVPAFAQEPPREIPDAIARKMLELGLKNIQRGLCGGLDGCAPATPEEFEMPPLTLPQVRIAIIAGAQSAAARWCGLDAEGRSINPMLRQVRQKMKLTERQAALMAVIHAIQMSLTEQHLKTRGECDEATRKRLDAQLPKE